MLQHRHVRFCKSSKNHMLSCGLWPLYGAYCDEHVFFQEVRSVHEPLIYEFNAKASTSDVHRGQAQPFRLYSDGTIRCRTSPLFVSIVWTTVGCHFWPEFPALFSRCAFRFQAT
jgi:hypothetical protein